MLQVHQLSKAYIITMVLDNVSFVLNDGEHVGLIGPNGAGKSTLIRCIVGDEQPDAGTIVRQPATLTIGYLPQSFASASGQTIADVIDTAQRSYVDAERELQSAADRLATASDMNAAMARYDRAVAAFEALGGYDREHRAAAFLDGLGLSGYDRATPTATLSGGQKTRLGLAALLLREPDLLILDEPTNHLDVAALQWLETFVQAYRGAVLVASHDRMFLDRTVTRILALDVTSHAIRSHNGNWSAWAAARAHEAELHAESYRRQQEYVAQVSHDILRLKAQALKVELASTPTDHDAKFALSGKGGSKKVAAKARSRQRKLERYLESDERVVKPRQSWNVKLDFGDAPVSGRAVLRVADVAFSYQESGVRSQESEAMSAIEAFDPHPPTPKSQPLLSSVSFEVFAGERVALVGANGAGKSTLLKLIAGQLQPLTGTIRVGTNVRPGVLAQEHETLDPSKTVLETVLQTRPMSETDARNFLHFFLFGGDAVFRRVAECSLGERSRLQLATLVLAGCNLLLLDEPLNHLDIEGREHFERALEAFDGTIIAVAHDRAFLQSYAERVIEIVDGGIVEHGDYDSFVRNS